MWGLNLALTKMGGGEYPQVLVWSFPQKKIKNPYFLATCYWRVGRPLSCFSFPPPWRYTQLMGQGLRIVQASPSHPDTHSARFLWTTDQSVAETSTSQHTTHTIDILAPLAIWTRNLASEQQQTHASARPLRLASQIQIIMTPKNHNNRTSYTARRRDIALNSLVNDAVINVKIRCHDNNNKNRQVHSYLRRFDTSEQF